MAVTFDAVGPSASGAHNAGASPITWLHTCAAGATELLVGIAVDLGSGDGAITASATYNGVAMTSVQRWESGGATQSAGFIQVFRMHSPPTGSALTVSVSYSGGSADQLSGGSLSFAGSSTISAATTKDSNSASVTSGTISVPTTSASNLVAVFMTCGSGGIAFTAGTSRFTCGADGAGAAGWAGGATAAGTGSNVSVSWTQTSDFYAAIGIEVQAAAVAATAAAPQRAVRPRIPAVQPAGLIYGSVTRPGGGDVSFGTGRIFFSPGGPVANPVRGPSFRPAVQAVRSRVPQNAPRGRVSANPGGPVANPQPPVTGPVFYPARQAVRARLPQPPAGMGALRGRAASSPPQPARNPAPGPVFRQKPAPVRYVLPPWQPRAGRITANPGARVANPRRGPPFYPFTSEVRAAFPQQPLLRGRAASSPGGPVANPGAVQVSGAVGGPVRASLPANPRGHVRVTPPAPAAGTPPVHAGPPFYPAVQAVRARLPQPLLRGRATSNPGAAVRDPSAGPAFRQAASPARSRITPPPRGRAASNPGGPVRNPVPGTAGPVFYPRDAAKPRQPLPRRGTCRAIRFGPLPANPSQGPAFTQATSPARARTPLPPRGRTAGSPGGPVQNPVPGVAGPPFYPFRSPARIRPSLPPRGRVSSGAGTPARNPHPGAAFPAWHGPVQARQPLPPRGRTGSNPGIPVVVQPVFAGPRFTPRHDPARIRPALPPRGRVSANPGAPVRNPRHGPVFTALDWPCRARIPQNAPRGRTASNPGGPVANIPFGNPLFRLGTPYFQWQSGTPVFAWAAGTPQTSA